MPVMLSEDKEAWEVSYPGADHTFTIPRKPQMRPRWACRTCGKGLDYPQQHQEGCS